MVPTGQPNGNIWLPIKIFGCPKFFVEARKMVFGSKEIAGTSKKV